jgi:chromosome segregation ATPase
MTEYIEMTSSEIDDEIERLESQIEKISNMNIFSEEDAEKQGRNLDVVRNKIKDLICVLEVEHFLETGPGGSDPL